MLDGLAKWHRKYDNAVLVCDFEHPPVARFSLQNRLTQKLSRGRDRFLSCRLEIGQIDPLIINDDLLLFAYMEKIPRHQRAPALVTVQLPESCRPGGPNVCPLSDNRLDLRQCSHPYVLHCNSCILRTSFSTADRRTTEYSLVSQPKRSTFFGNISYP